MEIQLDAEPHRASPPRSKDCAQCPTPVTPPCKEALQLPCKSRTSCISALVRYCIPSVARTAGRERGGSGGVALAAGAASPPVSLCLPPPPRHHLISLELIAAAADNLISTTASLPPSLPLSRCGDPGVSRGARGLSLSLSLSLSLCLPLRCGDPGISRLRSLSHILVHT